MTAKWNNIEPIPDTEHLSQLLNTATREFKIYCVENGTNLRTLLTEYIGEQGRHELITSFVDRMGRDYIYDQLLLQGGDFASDPAFMYFAEEFSNTVSSESIRYLLSNFTEQQIITATEQALSS
jgi:hypothetical protein